jgi:hypothetical protein
MWAYALIATGCINWSYQRGEAGVITNSAFVVVPGLVLIASTFNKTLAAKLETKAAMYFWGVLGLIALIYAFVN